MKLLEAFIFFAVLQTSLYAIVSHALHRDIYSRSARFWALCAAAGFALVVTSKFLLSTSVEERIVQGAGVSEQFVILTESSAYPYQRGLVLVPASLPLPFFKGVLVAVAPAGARLNTVRTGLDITVSATSLADGSEVPLVCAVPDALGARVLVIPQVPRCTTN